MLPFSSRSLCVYAAFQALGLDCAHWSIPLYNDLWRCALRPPCCHPDHLTRHLFRDCRVSGGNEEVLVRHFFATTGWPSTLSTADYGAFVGNVLAGKRWALEKAITTGDLPLRPGLAA